MPDQRNVYRNHRLAQLPLQGREEIDGAKVRADLNDGINVVTFKLIDNDI